MPTTINLGQVSAIKIGSVAPTNNRLLWYDTNITSGVNIKYYDLGLSQWVPLSSGGSSEINDSIISDDYTWSSEKIYDELQNINPDLSNYLQIGDNISELNNDAGYITSSDLPDLSDYLQSGDNISELVNNVGYITAAALPDLSSYLQSGDNISELVNDAGYIQAIQQGTNVSISGSGTLVDPYIISASGSGGGDLQATTSLGAETTNIIYITADDPSPTGKPGLGLGYADFGIGGGYVFYDDGNGQNLYEISTTPLLRLTPTRAALTITNANSNPTISTGFEVESGGFIRMIQGGGSGSGREIEIGGGIIVTDDADGYGIQYADDYSATFINRSLVDKEYVDSLPRIEAIQQGTNITITGDGTLASPYIINSTGGSGSSYTFENGLREEDGVVKLGLDLTTIGTTNLGILSERTVLSIGDIPGQEYTSIDLNVNTFTLQTINGSSNGGLLYNRDGNNELILARKTSSNEIQSLQITDAGLTITDTLNEIGLGDVSDYSANKTQYSYVTKKMLDEVASEGAFNVEDVTQIYYTDKAINVRAFNNTDMVYSEGSIDFGITRDSPHTMGLYAFKHGLETTASGDASLAFGAQTTASGDFSSAFGTLATASGYAASAFGDRTTASGDYSSAFGSLTITSGLSSSAFGRQTTASGDYSSAFGELTTASGAYSSAFGDQTTANEYASLSIGRFSTDGAAETSWTTGSPIFKVGNGTNSGNRSNAYVLYNDGRSEQVKDIEVTEIGQGVVIKSPDGTRWRITVDNSGNLTTTAL